MYKKISFPRTAGEQPNSGQIVLGYDEQLKKETVVRYRQDSNRFFDHPYSGSVYPLERMNKWRTKD